MAIDHGSETQFSSGAAVVRATPDDDSALTLHAAARVAGLSESTMRRLVRDGVVDVIKHGGVLRVSQSTAVELRGGAGLKRGPGVAVRAAERARGELAAECFAKFSAGKALIAIVSELQTTPSAVKALWNEWIDLQEVQRKSVVLTCHHAHRGGECDGAPLANVSLCGFHASHAHHLSEEKLAVLAGREVPTAVRCSSCDTMAPRGVCSACLSAVSIAVEGEGQGRRIVVRAREKVIAIVAATESRELARQLLLESDPPPIDETTTDPPIPRGVADILTRMQIEIDAERTE